MRFTVFSKNSYENNINNLDDEEFDSTCPLRRAPNSQRRSAFCAYPSSGVVGDQRSEMMTSVVARPSRRKYLIIFGLLVIVSLFRFMFMTGTDEDSFSSLHSMVSSMSLSALRGGAGNGNDSAWMAPIPPKYKVVQMQIVHRHGERSPITRNLLNETQLWPLPTEEQWDAVLNHRNVAYELIMERSDDPNDSGSATVASGQLTSKGLDQLIDLGRKIRDELLNHQIDPRRVVPASTDFPRTVQSAQGFLYGLLSPSATDNDNHPNTDNDQQSSSSPISIFLDLRHTTRMIPDPVPRRYPEMENIEQTLLQDKEATAKEGMMKEFGVFLTEKLFEENIINEDALTSFIGLGISVPDESKTNGKPMLPWNSLSELYKCLESAHQLPDGITCTDVQSVMDYVAWRWFHLLRNEYLANWSVSSLVKKLILNVEHFIDDEMKKGIDPNVELTRTSSPIYTFSAHDATLIALICAFRLNNPTKWPEYASFWKMELLQEENTNNYFVQFSLNNEILSSSWGLGGTTFRKGDSMRRFVPVEELKSQLQIIQNNLPASLY